jgi:hypothetical protein
MAAGAVAGAAMAAEAAMVAVPTASVMAVGLVGLEMAAAARQSALAVAVSVAMALGLANGGPYGRCWYHPGLPVQMALGLRNVLSLYSPQGLL